MVEKSAFLESLSDEQLGFFYAHKYDSDLDNLLEDELTAFQMKLFYKYRENEPINAEPEVEAQANAESELPTVPIGVFHFETEFETLKQNKDFVWLDIWRKSQADCEMEEFDQWREETIQNHFLSLLTEQELDGFINLADDILESEFVTSLDPAKQAVYKQWKEKPIPQIAPFITQLNVRDSIKTVFRNHARNQNFNELDRFIKSFPEFAERYKWWKAAITKNESSTNIFVPNEFNSQATNHVAPRDPVVQFDSHYQTSPERTNPTPDVTERPNTTSQEESLLEMIVLEVRAEYRKLEVSSEIPTSAPSQQPESVNVPECVNILVLDEIGEGKATYINLLSNYLKFANLREAERDGPKILVPTSFPYTDCENEMHYINAVPGQGDCTTANVTEGRENEQSRRKEPTSYLFVLTAENGKPEKKIRIIDTPCFGESGLQDQETHEKIMSHLASYQEIHCILIMVKPDCCRLYPPFKFLITELLAGFHSTASANVIFGYTCAKRSFYRPGSCHMALRKLLNDHKSINSKDNLLEPIFCFDSDSFCYLLGRYKGVKYTREEILRYEESWSKSREATTGVLKHIFGLKPHDVGKTLHLAKTRKVIRSLAEPLANATKTVLSNLLIQQDLSMTQMLNSTQSLLLHHCGEFALFVAESSLLAVDHYLDYLNLIIYKEKFRNKASQLLSKLQQYKGAYEHQVQLRKAASLSKTTGVSTCSADEITTFIGELKAHAYLGTMLEQVDVNDDASVPITAQGDYRRIELPNWNVNPVFGFLQV